MLNNDELHLLSEAVMDKWEELFEFFQIDYRISKNLVYCACPIHGGDKQNAFNFYHEGDSVRGNWKCRSHGCEKYFVSSILGLIRGVLSHNNGWEDGQRDRNKVVPFEKVINFAKEFSGVGKLLVDDIECEKRRFAKQASLFAEKKVDTAFTLTRTQVRKSLRIPAKYYINRGYSKTVLDEYDVGMCDAPYKEMSGRIVVPIYDDNYKYMVGCTGRSQFEKCKKCSLFHNPTLICPTREQWKYSKWRNCSRFQAESFLYNFWSAKEHILNSGVAVIVEGPGDVWRLVEAGINNAVALFGSSLKDGQKQALDKSGAMSLIVLTDNDEAGIKAAQDIQLKCGREYRLYFPKLSGSDVGDMSTDVVTKEIVPILNNIKGL